MGRSAEGYELDISVNAYQIGHGGTYPGQQAAGYQLDGAMNVHKVATLGTPAMIIANISKGEEAPGEWNGTYRFYYTWIYDGKQESKLYEYSGKVTASKQTMYFNFWIQEGQGGGFGLASTLGLSGHRIDKARIY